jgi:hypothetical protein
MQTSLVEQVRIFNRFYTREIGLLAEHLPGSEFTLAEARVLYELAQSREQTAADIIRSLGMDKAHISRIVARFQNAGMVKSRVSPEHGKQIVAGGRYRMDHPPASRSVRAGVRLGLDLRGTCRSDSWRFRFALRCHPRGRLGRGPAWRGGRLCIPDEEQSCTSREAAATLR